MTVVVRQAMVDDSGLFTDGTAITKAFVDSVYDTIDDQAHSTTNPTVKPKAVTDEVVAARGSKTSVDARLDVSLNEDGTLKTQASLVTAAQVQSALGSRNVANNGDLADWTAGGALAPDNFTLTGAAATIARTGPAMVDTFTFGTGGGGFAAKITRAGTDWKLSQDVIAAADFAKFVNVKGQKVSVAVKGKTGIASLLRIVIDDGVSTDASTYHTGGGTEEHLSVTHTISNSATKVTVYVEGTSSNGDAYVGGFVVVFADLAPSDWPPLSAIGDASVTSKGLVTLGAQPLGDGQTSSIKTVGGLASNSAPTYKPGGAASLAAKVIGIVHCNIVDVGNVGAGTDDLMTHALVAGALGTDGKSILRVTAWGAYAANANNKSLNAVFGGTSVALVAAVPINGVAWTASFIVVRNTATTQVMSAQSGTRSAGVWDATMPAEATPGETLANSITVKFTAVGTADNDVVQKGMIIEVLEAP